MSLSWARWRLYVGWSSLLLYCLSGEVSHTFFWSNLLNNVEELYKCSLVAFCGMVVHHEAYVAQEADVQHSTTLPIAKNITNAVLVMFGLGNHELYFEFLSKGDISDRGEEVEIHDFLHVLNSMI
jgi:hypothetical protein